MKAGRLRYVYGPVLSRRLGRSLGVDLVPFKMCTYDCIYCQLGQTTNKTIERKEYIAIEDILVELERKLASQDAPDYISLAGSGEPTLNSHIGDVIHRIKRMTDIPVAVLTNGSLLWMDEVQDALMAADLVLPSLDAGDEGLFRRVNRPHKDISFEQMVDGIIAFAGRFPGEIWLEVLLLAGMTSTPAEVEKIAAIAKRAGVTRVQLNTVSRPPAEEFALPVSTDQMYALKNIFHGKVDIVSEEKKNSCKPATSNIRDVRDEDILALLSRRPCTSADVAAGLGIHVTEAVKHLGAMVMDGEVESIVAGGHHFYAVKVQRKTVSRVST